MSFTHPRPSDPDGDELRRAMRGLPPVCPDEWTVGVVVQANGNPMVKGQCVTCGKLSANFAPKASVRDVNALPVFRDHRTGRPCERCNATDGVELHHWAPRHLFDDECDLWPTSWLCPRCHQRWHVIVTPGMSRRRAS